MFMMRRNLLYEKYHLNRKFMKRIIGEQDFTYRTLIHFFKKYKVNKARVLDVGCGVGTIDFYLANLGNFVIGLDISQNAIVIARQNAINLKLSKRVKFYKLDFPTKIPKGKFDVIVCSEVLEHLLFDELAVQKIQSLLNKGGIVIASSPSQNSPLYKLGRLNEFDKKVGHVRRYSEQSFKGLFEKTGLQVLETMKTEGIFRNFLFTNSFGGFLLKIVNKFQISGLVTLLDNLTIPVFGESDIYLVARKK